MNSRYHMENKGTILVGELFLDTASIQLLRNLTYGFVYGITIGIGQRDREHTLSAEGGGEKINERETKGELQLMLMERHLSLGISAQKRKIALGNDSEEQTSLGFSLSANFF